ncbi:MAG: tetrahydrodipicolinate N-succinyltransferase N-terminal domain-containing protein [Candidatus Pacebacteria bacterium]|nr:tetrahydrodipicolinate N-succinyltransferase N-terminal domain-containing protein [Candidatus Paceibacterota bacterium]
MAKIATKAAFDAFVTGFEAKGVYARPLAFGVGLATKSSEGRTLDTLYPHPNYGTNHGTAAVLAAVLGYKTGNIVYPDVGVKMLTDILTHFDWLADDAAPHPNIDIIRNIRATLIRRAGDGAMSGNKVCVVTFIGAGETDRGSLTVPDAYLRLHLLSHRLVKPHGIKLDGVFDNLPNNIWSNEGPIAEEDLMSRQIQAGYTRHPLMIHARDKFPRMLDYVAPSKVRIADASRVRLGAHLGEGTVVMHEGFVNFNAGCEGPNMIEGRVSAGVFVKEGTDIGGGASIMGTMSGGGKEVITVGKKCLIGANSGVGITLGDYCTVEAGLYVTAGMPVQLEDGSFVKAETLSGQNEMLFIRDSKCGAVKMLRRKNKTMLNAELHET